MFKYYSDLCPYQHCYRTNIKVEEEKLFKRSAVPSKTWHNNPVLLPLALTKAILIDIA